MIKLNPITQKRLQRFRQIKRAYYSFWLLVGLYALGLIANLISNDRPLYLRYEGQSYFPFLFTYPEREFVPNGELTRPDYKKVNQTKAFAENEDNYMIFPLIPYGPYDSVTPDSLEVDNSVTVEIEREGQVATVNVSPEFVISKSQNPKIFFDGLEGRALRKKNLKDYWSIAPEIKAGIAQRFENKAAEAVSAISENEAGLQIEMSLSNYKPRSRAPRTIRITIREQVKETKAEEIVFAPDMTITQASPLWKTLDPTIQENIRDKVKQRAEKIVRPETIKINGLSHRVRYEKEDIYFPYKPVGDHYLGLDSSGRDVTARILYALRTSLNFGFTLVFVTMLLGIIIGAIQGYLGGKVDLISQRVIEIWESLPFLYILILMGSIYGRSFGLLLFIYCIFNWIGISYYMRGEFLKLRKQPFVEAAHCMGIAPIKIIWKHLLPNGLVPIVTFFPFSLVGAIGVLAALDYLGFGLPAPTPSWGELLSQAQEFKYAWWLALYPALSLFGVGLLGVFIGEGVRAAFDPRTNSRIE